MIEGFKLGGGRVQAQLLKSISATFVVVAGRAVCADGMQSGVTPLSGSAARASSVKRTSDEFESLRFFLLPAEQPAELVDGVSSIPGWRHTRESFGEALHVPRATGARQF